MDVSLKPIFCLLFIVCLFFSLITADFVVCAEITVDGSKDDWANVKPEIADIKGDINDGCSQDGSLDLKFVYTTMDADYVYIMIETYEQPIFQDIRFFEINVDYKEGQAFFHDPGADAHINIAPYGESISCYYGPSYEQMTEIAISDYKVAIGDVFEARIALSDFGGPAYFVPTFANIWTENSPAGEGCDSTDPVSAILPVADIRIDSSASDWQNIEPLMIDSVNDSQAPEHDGTDMDKCFAAVSKLGDVFYFKIDVHGNTNTEPAPPPEEEYSLVQYMLAFDDPLVDSHGSWCDYQIGFNNLDFWIWDLTGTTGYEDPDNLSVSRHSETPVQFAQGETFVEFSIPLSMIKNANNLRLVPYLTLNEEDITTTDGADYSSFVHVWRSRKRISNSLGMEFVYIEPGTFVMGSPTDEPGRYADEIQHQVTLTQDFYMQTTEVTQGQWKSVTGSNPSYFGSCGDACPVEQVSWNEVQNFIDELNAMGEGTYRLPTEAEWEYACRAGSKTAFANGEITETGSGYDPVLDSMSWYEYNSNSRTHPVGQKGPNDWGLYDMHGNVMEWVFDWYDSYPSSDVVDPKGPDLGTSRVLRGGSWDLNAGRCRSAFRIDYVPWSKDNNYGLRLVRESASGDDPDCWTPMYRFYNTNTGVHFYTANEAERDHVQATYEQFNYEGTVFSVPEGSSEATMPVYRFYNTDSGVHFYTISEAEKDHVIATYPQFNFEGIVYYAYEEEAEGTIPLFRFYNASGQAHFYTASAAERDHVIDNYPFYDYEGIAYYVYPQ